MGVFIFLYYLKITEIQMMHSVHVHVPRWNVAYGDKVKLNFGFEATTKNPGPTLCDDSPA